MDRQRRSEEENSLWRDPCGYNNDNSGGVYSSKTAKNVAQQAKNVLHQATSYKESFATLYSYDTFDSLLNDYKDDWLRKFPWMVNEVLPENKILFQAVDDTNVDNIMGSIDKHLPLMYKALKMIVASLHKLSGSLKDDGITADQELAEKVSQTMKDVRAVLCYFYDLMKARGATIERVYDSDVPDINSGNKLDLAIYVYRDSLNYLEYLSHVFQKMSDFRDLPVIKRKDSNE